MTKCTKFDPNQRKGFESTWMSLSGPKCTWFCLPLGLQNLPIPELSSPGSADSAKISFFLNICFALPAELFCNADPPLRFFAQVKSAQKLQGVITLYFTRSRCRNGIGECEREPGNLWYMYPCCRWNVWQNYYHPRTFLFFGDGFSSISACSSTLKVALIPSIFPDQCGKLSFNWMGEQCAFGTSFHI